MPATSGRCRRTGGQARRLTSTPFVETDPHFSPDGSQIAFTATVGGNTDVYVMSAAGGEPTRLTYHPGIDAVRGWSPDGGRVVIASTRDAVPTPGVGAYFRLWTMALDNGKSARAAGRTPGTAADAAGVHRHVFARWPSHRLRGRRGGASPPSGRRSRAASGVTTAAARTHPIRVIDLADNSVEKLPWTDSNDTAPMWVGDSVYFLSDRGGTTNLFSYDPRTKQVAQLTRHDDFDIMSASAGPDAIVYEQAGTSISSTPRRGRRSASRSRSTADFPWARPQIKKVATMIRSAVLSPTGVRAAFEASGDIFTVPAEKGRSAEPDASAGVHDRSPVWSPDGAQIAWLSDASGEYQLMIGEQTGATKPREIALPSKAFFSTPAWSPDGKQLLLEDNHLNLWASTSRAGPPRSSTPTRTTIQGAGSTRCGRRTRNGSAYSKSLDSHLRAIFLYSVAEKKAYQVTDGLSDATAPAFDAGGKYLYFLASTNLRAADGLAGDELGGSADHARHLSGGAERERAVAVSAGNWGRDRHAAAARQRVRAAPRQPSQPRTRSRRGRRRSASMCRASASGFWRSRCPPPITAR